MEKYPSETRIILALKNGKPLGLGDLSEKIGISRMAVLNHLQRLEAKGIVERRTVKESVGRPHYVFRIREESKERVADSNGWILDGLLEYLEKTGNSKLAENFLKERYDRMRDDYSERLSTVKEEDRVNELLRIREEENYFPELKSTGKGTFELLEFNCPIYKISRKFGLACSLETRLFSSVLDAKVSSTHRQVDGSDVCRFLIRKKSNP